jgi:23S rRNA pseudouridine2605 synthase
VRVFGKIDNTILEPLKHGVTIDGVKYAPIMAELERQQGDNAWLLVTLTEGKNREIRKVMEYLGYSVNRLLRVSYGPFQLGKLAEGAVEEVPLRILKASLGRELMEKLR